MGTAERGSAAEGLQCTSPDSGLYCSFFRPEFPKIRGTLFWGGYNKDPTI